MHTDDMNDIIAAALARDELAADEWDQQMRDLRAENERLAREEEEWECLAGQLSVRVAELREERFTLRSRVAELREALLDLAQRTENLAEVANENIADDAIAAARKIAGRKK